MVDSITEQLCYADVTELVIMAASLQELIDRVMKVGKEKERLNRVLLPPLRKYPGHSNRKAKQCLGAFLS